MTSRGSRGRHLALYYRHAQKGSVAERSSRLRAFPINNSGAGWSATVAFCLLFLGTREDFIKPDDYMLDVVPRAAGNMHPLLFC